MPLLINQQIVSVDAMQVDPNGACEFLALTVPEGEHVSSIVGHLGGAPFWHRSARAQRIYPHNAVNGVRMLDVNRNWENGDLLRSRFLVWQRHHILQLLMGTAQEDNEDSELDFSSFLQLSGAQSRSGDVVADCFAEVCVSLKQQMVQGYEEGIEPHCPEQGQVEFLPMWVAHAHSLETHQGMAQDQTDETSRRTSLLQRQALMAGDQNNKHYYSHEFFADQYTTTVDERVEKAVGYSANCSRHVSVQRIENSLCDASGPQEQCGGGGNLDPTWHSAHGHGLINSLNAAVATLCLPGWKGINADVAEIPQLHPCASIACQYTVQDSKATGDFHIFTDGSSRKGHAAWAFNIVCARHSQSGTSFMRVGFAGGELTDDVGPVSITPHDAESTAIIAACEYLLSRQDASTIRVCLHFDAIAAGFGSTGQNNIIRQDPALSQRQKAARILVSLVQRRNNAFLGCHVYAHEGQPWNEMADSIAKQVAQGWMPGNQAELRSGVLLKHPLRDWAWMQISPTDELPCLETVIQNETPNPSRATVDATLDVNQEQDRKSQWAATINFASVNVETLEQDHVVPQTQVTYKAAELMLQFVEANLHFIGIQESRARSNGRTQHGPFACLVSAGDNGQAGVELWINEQAVADALGIPFQAHQDVGVWHATSRIMAATCHFGQESIDVLVAYAPQRGQGDIAVSNWWKELHNVLQKREQNFPCFLLGDFNCRLGSVETELIGGVGAEFEDFAGQYLRELCHNFRLLIPSTMSEFHTGASWTHINARGTCHRLDYILVSDLCRSGISSSWVDYDIDVMNGDRDHKVVVVSVALEITTGSAKSMKRTPLYNRNQARDFQKHTQNSLIANMPMCPWLCDTNEHWSRLRDFAQQVCVQSFPKTKRTPRQLYFTEKVWNVLCYRKDLRQEHRSVQRARNQLWLNFCFQGWRSKGLGDQDYRSWKMGRHLFNLQEAVTLEMRRQTDLKFRQLKKHAWKAWVRQQLDTRVQQLQGAKASEIYQILKPRRIIDQKRGRNRRHLPGLQDHDGVWRTSRADIALSWKTQFAAIEHAQDVQLQQLLEDSKARSSPITEEQILQIPTLYELEGAIRNMNVNKATGVDGLGAELWKMNTAHTAMRIFSLFLKCSVRRQAIVEHAGGWILPLFKGKGNPCKMAGYRAILLEPTLARVFSRTWRSRLADGLSAVSANMQWGGRKGLGITPLHLQVRLWQSNALHSKKSIALIFIDLKQAFYSVVKPMLAGFDGSVESAAQIFQLLKLPPTAFQAFLENIGTGSLIQEATGSSILADYMGANLSATWFTVPNGCCISTPQTGSRPGDPCADLLFGFIMTHMLRGIHSRALEAGIPLQQHTDNGVITNCVTWVDDVAMAVLEDAETLVQKTTQLVSIVMDVTLEHGMQMSYGQGKTAVILEFRGDKAKQSRQKCESEQGDALLVLSEHGSTRVPVVSHYKHLGGHVVRGRTLLPEIHTRGATAMQNLAPLKHILQMERCRCNTKRC